MYLAIDIGGTKTLLALFSRNGRLLRRRKIKSYQDPEKWKTELGRQLPKILPLRRKLIRAVTISYPGVLINDLPSNAKNLPLWKGEKIAKDISIVFEKNRINCPIYYKNDADLGAIYECRNIPKKTIYLTFGTGIGGGIVTNGKLLLKSAFFEPGHKKYTYKGLRQEWEKIASSKAIREVNNDLDVTKIKEEKALEDIACRFSIGLTDIIKENTPNNIVISGPIAEILPLFRPILIKILSANSQIQEIPRILKARHPQESVIYGAFLYGKKQAEK